MRVKCKWVKGAELSEAYVDERVPINLSTDWYLTNGKEYEVYAVECYEGKTWYYVLDDQNLWFPIMKPAILFEIVDPKLSASWRAAHRLARDHKTGEYSIGIFLLAFEEWCTDPVYYERLTDRGDVEVAIFARRRKEIDSE